MSLHSGTIDLAWDDDVFQRKIARPGWGDGLAVVAPTADRVAAMLAGAWCSADHPVAIEPVKGRPLTAEKVAVDALLAGCCPVDSLLLVAAVEALCADQVLVHGATDSTGGAPSCIVSAGGGAGGFAAVIPPSLGPKSAAATAAVGARVECS